MKNAYVLHHHYGDAGSTLEGMILRDLHDTKFNELQRAGLVREATPAEVREGFKPAFQSEAEATKAAAPPANKMTPEAANKAVGKAPASKAA